MPNEMLLVGRGGEGVVLASQILADAFARAGHWVQSFPEFKAERRGAPLAAFLRWDEDEPIHRRYGVRRCDVLVVISPSPPAPELLAAVRPGGLVVLNRAARLPLAGEFAVARLPASRIARANGVLSSEGRPMGNTAMLGAAVRLLLPDGLPHLEQAIAARIGRAAAANVAAARAGHAQVTRQHAVAGDERVDAVWEPPAPHPAVSFPVSSTGAGANHTGAWSLERPVVREACTACGVCALFCPDGAISPVDGAMVVDELYCKGCGICAVVCPVRDAIAMEEVAA